MSQKLLVTGASGYLGTALLPVLLLAGYEVRVLSRNVKLLQAAPWVKAVEVMEGDLTEVKVAERAVEGVDAIVHLAGLAHTRASEAQHQQQNFLNTQQLATAAVAAGVQRFVFISSCKVRYPTHSFYAKYKRASEEYLLGLQEKLAVVCLRPGIIYGPGMQNNLQALLSLLNKPTLPAFITATKPVSMISQQDCCSAIVAALTQPTLVGRVWELNDGTAYSLQQLIEQIRHSKGLALPWFYCPPWLLWVGLALGQQLPMLRSRGLGLTTYQALFNESYPADASFTEASGLQPTTNFYQMLPLL